MSEYAVTWYGFQVVVEADDEAGAVEAARAKIMAEIEEATEPDFDVEVAEPED